MYVTLKLCLRYTYEVLVQKALKLPALAFLWHAKDQTNLTRSMCYTSLTDTNMKDVLQPRNKQVSKELVHELEFGDIAVVQI